MVLAGVQDGKVSIVVASDKSVDAQVAVKELAKYVGGGGGGSTQLALAGGRDPSGLEAALVAAAAAWNLMGAKSVADSSLAMGIVLLAPFAVLTVYGFLHRATPTAGAVPLHNVDLLGGILVALWNYMGWDYASTVADEVDRPQRTYPLAMAGAVALVAVTYVLPIAAVAMTGLDANRWSTGG